MKLIKNKIILSLLIAVFVAPNLSANNGQDLFKQNCAACHKVQGTLVGPPLGGVSAKWADAGEAANLIEWVKNPRALFESGKSELAKAAWDISPIEMAPQAALNDEQILAIFDFIDGKGEPVEETNTKTVEGNTPEIVDNPSRKPGEPLSDEIFYTPEQIKAMQKEKNSFNRILFVFLIVLAGCIVAGIVSISKTTQSFITLIIKRGDKPNKSNKKENNIVKAILAIVSLTPLTTYASTGAESSAEWFVVSNTHILILFACNLVLLWVFFEQKKTLKSVIEQYDPSLLKKRNKAGEEVKEESITQLLTGAVAIEDEASILMDHDFDGIRELDNNLPPWWVWGFVASIIFAIFYLTHYHVTKTGDLQIAEYDKSVAEAQVEIDAYMSTMAMNVDESNVTILTESADVNNGKALFTTNCVVCHKDKGEGLIGPNLTDKYWLTGNGSINDVFKTIKYGTTNGMPEHESKMNPVELQQVASYVLQLEYTEGKAPEGEEVK